MILVFNTSTFQCKYESTICEVKESKLGAIKMSNKGEIEVEK